MKKWYFALPLLGTAAAVGLNLAGFWMGGPREGWELAVSLGYLACWVLFLLKGGTRRQMVLSRIWWIAAAVCCAACFCVVTLDWDGFLLMLPAMAFVSPLSGLAVWTGTEYPVFYGLCTILSITLSLWTFRRSGRSNAT